MHFDDSGANGLLNGNIQQRNKKRTLQDVALWVGLGVLATIGACYSTNYLSIFSKNAQDMPSSMSLLTEVDGKGQLQVGSVIRFESLNYPTNYLRNSNYEMWLATGADDFFLQESSYTVEAGLAGGGSFSYQSKNYPSYYICHDEGLLFIKQSAGIEAKCSWDLVPANTADYYHIQQFDNAGWYVRHEGYRAKLHEATPDQSDLFYKDASWAIRVVEAAPTVRTTVSLAEGSTVRFNSFNYPDTYLRHSNYEIWQHADDSSDLFQKDSSFKVVACLAGGADCASFQSVNYPEYYLSHDGNELMWIKKVTIGQEGRASWYVVESDSPDYVHLESYDQGSKYVRHQGARGKLHSDDGSDLFNKDSKWKILTVQSVTPSGPSYATLTKGQSLRFNSFNYPDTYLRHQNYEIWQHDDDGSDLFMKDSTFTVVDCLAGDANCYSFESFNYPGYYLSHDGADLIWIKKLTSGQEGRASWYIVESDSPDYFHLESYDQGSKYVRHQNARGKLHADDGSDLFNKDSKWAFEYLTTTTATYVTLPEGQHVRFNSYNYPHDYLRHSNYEIWKHDDDDSDLFMRDSTFKAVPGLAGGESQSFESQNYPGYYLFHDGELVYIRQVASGQEGQASWYLLDTATPSYYRIESFDWATKYIRHQDSRAKVHADDGSNLFNEDSQWSIEYIHTPTPEPDPVLTVGDHVRFRSENYPNDFMRHSNYEMWKHPDDGSDLFDGDSTYIVRAGLEGLGSYSFESYNYPGYYLYHDSDLLYIRTVSAGTEPRASWYAKASDGDYIKLESFDKADHYARHQNSRIKLHPDDASDLYNKDSNFLIETVSGLNPYTPRLTAGSTAKLQSNNYPGHYLRHQNYEIWKHSDDGSDLYKYDSTFWVREGLSGLGSVSFESYNYPNYYLYHENDLLYIRQVAAGKEAKASWYERDSTGSYFKLESFDKPGYYVRHQNNRGKLHTDDGSTLFDEDSNWSTSSPTFPTGSPTAVDYTGTAAVGQRYGFSSIDRNDQLWKHVNFQGFIDPNTNDPITDDSYLFDVVTGLAGQNTISFRSVNYPDRYLRQDNYFINLDSGSTQQFLNDASFTVKNGFYGDGGVVFESKTHPGYYIGHDTDYRLILKAWDGTQATNKAVTWVSKPQSVDPALPAYPLTTGGTIRLTPKGQDTSFFRHLNFEMWIALDDSTDSFLEDSSFIIEEGLAGTGTVSLRSVNHPTYFLYHDSLYLYVGLVSSGNEGKASFYPRQSTQGDYARFESFDTLEYFIGSNNGRGVLLHNDGTQAVNDLISWSVWEQDEIVDPYDQYVQIGSTYAFLSSTEENKYWKHSNFALWEVTNNGDVALDANFQFYIVEGLAGPGTISFRSVNNPDMYLRHSFCDMWLHQGSGIIFGDSASFFVRQGLHGVGGISFESYDSPNHYIRVDGERISIDKLDCCNNYRADATFYAVEVPTVDDSIFATDDLFVAQMDANLYIKVTQETLTTEMVTNANDQILLQLVVYDETRQNEQLFQQTGGITYLGDDPLAVDISIPYYNFKNGMLAFTERAVTDIQFGVHSSQEVSFSDVVQQSFDPMGFYRVTVFVTKVVIQASFTASNSHGHQISGIYQAVQYANPAVQVNLIGQAEKSISISGLDMGTTICKNC